MSIELAGRKEKSIFLTALDSVAKQGRSQDFRKGGRSLHVEKNVLDRKPRPLINVAFGLATMLLDGLFEKKWLYRQPLYHPFQL